MQRLARWRPPIHRSRPPLRAFTTTCPILAKPLPPRPKVSEDDISEAFLKGSGPGGQKINKTSSAVQLKHLPTGLVVKCQETRSRSQNRKIARRILAERIEEAELGDGARTVVKGKEKGRKKASKDKKARRKYRKLADGLGGEGDGEENEGEADGRDVEHELVGQGEDEPDKSDAERRPDESSAGMDKG